MTAGRLVYHLYFKPKALLWQIRKKGLLNYMRIERSRRRMLSSSKGLSETNRTGLPEYAVYFLTGKKYWYQTAYCLYSLQKTLADSQINAVFVDDGTFDNSLIKQITKQFPGSKIKTRQTVENLISEYLPVSKYPLINKKRAIYPHIRKLTDIHAGAHGWKMVLDSDVLFFKNPAGIVDWLKRPDLPFFLYDPCYSYHYSISLMEKLTGKRIESNLNVGAIGLKSELIDWDKIESWIANLEEAEGSTYFLEQALSAMLVSGQEIHIADKKSYIVLPNENEAEKPEGIMHHYVAEAKDSYYKFSWKIV